MSKKVIIVGGVAGGASAAARLRRLDEDANIILFERGEHISFANCGLPYYIGERIKDRSKLLVQTPKSMSSRFNIDVRNNSEVIGIDIKNKKVKVNSKTQGIYEEDYDYLILSPGAKALKPNIPGINNEKIFVLRNIPDTDAIKTYVDSNNVKHAVVIGGGYVGVEMAENLIERGIKVTLVEAAPHVLAPFDSDMVVIAEKEMELNGIKLILNDGVKAFQEDQNLEIVLNSGKRIVSDMVILAIGVAPDTAFINESGIEVGVKGHIKVNEQMQTNIDHIYAVGDAVEVIDFVTGNSTAVPLAGPANKQGRIAADNVSGLNSTYKGTQGTSIIKVFDLTAASTGKNERELKRLEIPFKKVTIHPVSHATYYPGALPMTLKLLFDDKGKVLGAQGVGYDGVDKRIDVIATAIRMKATVYDLTELELSYAPPFSSAKDPVNMAGYVACNLLEGKSNLIDWDDLENYNENEYILLDVRSEDEYNNGHIKGAKNIPIDNLRERILELDKNKTIVEYCQVGLRGYIADRILSQKGYHVVNVSGGYKSVSSLNFKPSEVEVSAFAKVENLTKTFVEKDTQILKVDDNQSEIYDKAIDACGLACPGPLMQVKANVDELKEGQILKVTASDPGFYEDIKAWCKRTNNELKHIARSGADIVAFIRKRSQEDIACQDMQSTNLRDNKTMVVFSGDLDRAIASFIIANGAASMGKKVTMFFTFWGLNILRKEEKVKVKKGFMDKMFGAMMPRGSKKLKLSNMNMMGMGGKMIRNVMKKKNITSLEDLINAAIESGIEIVACQMSMDVMGLAKEELIDGIKIGGVGYYLGEAEDANVNLFI